MQSFRFVPLRLFHLGRMRDHSFCFGLRLFGLFFFGVRLPGILIFFRFGGIFFRIRDARLMRFFLCGEIPLLGVARDFLRLRFGHLLGESGSFVFAQPRSGVVFMRRFHVIQLFGIVRGRQVLRWALVNCRVRFAGLPLPRLFFAVMLHRGDGSSRVPLGGMIARFPFRKRLAGKWFKTAGRG